MSWKNNPKKNGVRKKKNILFFTEPNEREDVSSFFAFLKRPLNTDQKTFKHRSHLDAKKVIDNVNL